MTGAAQDLSNEIARAAVLKLQVKRGPGQIFAHAAGVAGLDGKGLEGIPARRIRDCFFGADGCILLIPVPAVWKVSYCGILINNPCGT